MMASFLAAYRKTMAFEGKYVNDSADAGGETYKGISRRYNPNWCGWEKIDQLKAFGDFPGILDRSQSIQNDVQSFYRQHFWDKLLGDEIPSQEIAEELFDTNINLGLIRAVTFLQIGLNMLNRNEILYADIVEDGNFGPKTLLTLKTYLQHDKIDYLLKIINILQGKHYIDFMKKSPLQEKFARGWLERVQFLKDR